MPFLVVVAFVLKGRGGRTQHPLYFHRRIGRVRDPHPATLSLPLLNRTGGEVKVKTFVDQDKDKGDHLAIAVTGKTDWTCEKVI